MAYNIIKKYDGNQIAVLQSGLTQRSAKTYKNMVNMDNIQIVTDGKLMKLAKTNNITRQVGYNRLKRLMQRLKGS